MQTTNLPVAKVLRSASKHMTESGRALGIPLLYCEDSSRLRPIVDQKMVRKGNAADWVT